MGLAGMELAHLLLLLVRWWLELELGLLCVLLWVPEVDFSAYVLLTLVLFLAYVALHKCSWLYFQLPHSML